jgi:hypothetical protein
MWRRDGPLIQWCHGRWEQIGHGYTKSSLGHVEAFAPHDGLERMNKGTKTNARFFGRLSRKDSRHDAAQHFLGVTGRQ